jgi:hypothetical protein
MRRFQDLVNAGSRISGGTDQLEADFNEILSGRLFGHSQ